MIKNRILEMLPIGDDVLRITYGPPWAQCRPVADPVTAIVGGVSAGANIFGGIFGRKSAKSAAQIQADAAAAAGKKVEDAAANTNPQVISTAAAAGDQLRSTATALSGDVTDAANKAGAGVTTAVTDANKLLDPYSGAGTTAADILKAGIAQGGEFNKTPTMADITIDPGYEFRKKEAEQALERSAAAHGGTGSGGFLKDLNNYIQGSASQEYAAAFDRFLKSSQNRFSNVFNVSRAGQEAAGTQGSNLIGGARYVGDTGYDAAKFGAGLGFDATKTGGEWNIGATNLTTGRTIDAAKTAGEYATQGANAKAAGEVAGSNALWGGIAGAGNAAMGAYQTSQLLKNPGRNYINPFWMTSPGRP